MTELTIAWDGERAPLAKAFVAAQKATEAVKKASTNPAFKSKYADLAGVVEAVVPALNAAGVGVLQFPGYDGELVTVTTTFLHEGGSSVTSTLALRPSKQDPQGIGSAVTYGRRYALLAMSGAAPEDDDANAASGPVRRNPVPPAPVSKNAERVPASAAQLKREGEDARIREDINGCDLSGIAEWTEHFDTRTAHLPISWLDPIRDMIELRKEELLAGPAPGEAEMDAAFRDTLGPVGAGSVAGRNGAAVLA
jgi:hypothetical protein